MDEPDPPITTPEVPSEPLDPLDPYSRLQAYRELATRLRGGQPGNMGGGLYPVKTRTEMREIARLLTLANPKVRMRLLKESENGTMPVPIFIELVRQGWGMAEQKVKVEETERQRPGLRTVKPIGYDPLNPDNPDLKVIEAIYQHVPALPGAAAPAAPEREPVKPKLNSTIVPRPDLAAQQPEPLPPGLKRRVPKRPPEDDGTAPLRVDGI